MSSLLFLSCELYKGPPRPYSGLLAYAGETYKLWLPPDFEENRERSITYPLVIALHGRTSLTDHYFQPCIVNDEQQRNEYPCVYVAPNNSDKGFGENAQWIRKLIHRIIEDREYRIDTNRIYIIGFSMGAHGATYMAQDLYSDYAYLTAGIVPVGGGVYEYMRSPELLNNTAMWTNYGLEGDYSQESDYTAAKEYNSSASETVMNDFVSYTGWDNQDYTYFRETRTLTRIDGVDIFKISTYEGMGHSSSPVFKDPPILNWLFDQTLLNR